MINSNKLESLPLKTISRKRPYGQMEKEPQLPNTEFEKLSLKKTKLTDNPLSYSMGSYYFEPFVMNNGIFANPESKYICIDNQVPQYISMTNVKPQYESIKDTMTIDKQPTKDIEKEAYNEKKKIIENQLYLYREQMKSYDYTGNCAPVRRSLNFN